MRDKSAAQWWGQALHHYRNLCHAATAENVAIANLPSVNEKQVELFEAALQQQLSKKYSESDKTSKRKQNASRCQMVLFVDASGVCDELAQAAQAAGIKSLQQMLPEHTTMVIHADQVQVGSSGETNHHAWDVIWSAQEETALQNSLKELACYLGIAEAKLRLMVDAGQLKVHQQGRRLQFACDGITATVRDEHA